MTCLSITNTDVADYRHEDENKRAGWCLLLSDIWAGNISYFVDWLKTKSVEAEMDIVLHMVLHKLHNWELNTWLEIPL